MEWKGAGVKTGVITGVAILAVVTLALFCAATPRARLNVTQAAAILIMALLFCAAIRFPGHHPAITDAPDIRRNHMDRLWFWLAPGLVAVVFLPALTVCFLSDDFVHVAQLQLQTPLQTFWQHLTEGQAATFFRPLGFLSLALDVQLWGQWAPGYHLTSLGWHILGVAGLYALTRALDWQPPAAALAAGLFALLPVQVEAVVWPAARFDLLATAGLLWSGVSYLRYRRQGHCCWYLSALVLGALALLAKESAFVLPLLILLLDLRPGRQTSRRRHRLWPFFALTGFLFAYRWFVLGGIGGYSTADGLSSFGQISPLTLLGLFVRAPAHLLTGVNLCDMAAWPALAAVVLLLGTAGTTVWLSIIRPHATGPDLRLGLAWMFIALLPAHALLLIGPGLCGSRVLYLSAAGWAIVLVALLRQQEHPGLRRWLSVLLIAACCWGVRHNLQAWRNTGETARAVLDTLAQTIPQPPPGTVFHLVGFPGTLNGVYFFHEGLAEAIALHYDRRDLPVCISAVENGECPPELRGKPLIEVRWLEDGSRRVEIRQVNDRTMISP